MKTTIDTATLASLLITKIVEEARETIVQGIQQEIENIVTAAVLEDLDDLDETYTFTCTFQGEVAGDHIKTICQAALEEIREENEGLAALMKLLGV
jgi:hypothetical protein